ncbi:hypothetical protein [Clostridium tagluense]|uniref:Uncharacterized protein n=1 Tax=Clostridium tagluense TaxID=360422 RepID=A0A401UUI7_9CLOT|nr:hypothetical protein [Clostridium tagluense]GCD13156.1 hypothetical protein Ctaglu_47790 [Clostridium tagluense]
MSVVISYVSEYISIIATDTRICFATDADNILYHTDDNEKLIDVNNMGWCAGAGNDDLITKFKDSIYNTEIKKVGDFKNIFVEAFNKISQNNLNNNLLINETAVVLSWSGADYYTKKQCCRVGILSHNISEAVGTILNNNISILFPYEYLYNIDLKKSFSQSYIFDYKFNYEEFDLSLENILKTIFNMFKEIYLNSKMVSSTCDVGIHLINHDKVRITNDIDILIKKVNEGEIQTEYKVI